MDIIRCFSNYDSLKEEERKDHLPLGSKKMLSLIYFSQHFEGVHITHIPQIAKNEEQKKSHSTKKGPSNPSQSKPQLKLAKLTVAQLRDQCRNFKLKQVGNKATLMENLEQKLIQLRFDPSSYDFNRSINENKLSEAENTSKEAKGGIKPSGDIGTANDQNQKNPSGIANNALCVT